MEQQEPLGKTWNLNCFSQLYLLWSFSFLSSVSFLLVCQAAIQLSWTFFLLGNDQVLIVESASFQDFLEAIFLWASCFWCYTADVFIWATFSDYKDAYSDERPFLWTTQPKSLCPSPGRLSEELCEESLFHREMRAPSVSDSLGVLEGCRVQATGSSVYRIEIQQRPRGEGRRYPIAWWSFLCLEFIYLFEVGEVEALF